MKGKFSVLISVYKKENPLFLEQSLNSVIHQTFPPNEIVLVEDGPLNDGLYEVINKFAEHYPILKTVRLPENVGLGAALNEGLKFCTNSIVARMDSDDISKPDRFEKQIKIFQDHRELAVVGGWIDEFSTNPETPSFIRKVPEKQEQIERRLKRQCPLNHVSVMFKKEEIIDVGGYQPLYYQEDYWLWCRLIAQKKKIYNIQEVLVDVRGGDDLIGRRGGMRYLKSEITLQKRMLELGLINPGSFFFNILVRTIVRLSPASFRKLVYRFLRESCKKESQANDISVK